MENLLNAIKARLSLALFPADGNKSGPVPPALMPAPIDGDMSQQLTSVGHMCIPPSKLPPQEGFVYIENNCLKALDDLTDYERDRREMIEPLLAEWAQMYLDLCDLKARTVSTVAAFRERHVFRNSKRKQRGYTPSLSIFSLDRSMCLTERHSDRVSLDDTKVAEAKELFDECFKAWGDKSPKEMRQAVEISFKRKKSGDYSREKIVELCQIESDDQRWNDAIAIIRKAELVDGVATHYLVAVRDSLDKYQPLPLDIANVRPYRKEALDQQEPQP